MNLTPAPRRRPAHGRLTLVVLSLMVAACTSDSSPSAQDPAPPPPPAPTLQVFAGQASGQGFLNGTRAQARFSYPGGLSFDAAGNAYVADGRNHVIRKITPGGDVTTVAGVPGRLGSSDGPRETALLNGPADVVADLAGNLYVADAGNSLIRKVSAATGQVSTLAGAAGQYGSADGQGAAAQFSGVNALVIDAQGNLFVADNWNSTIRKITPAGLVSTLAGSAGAWGHADGKGAEAQFSGTNGIAIDAAGNLYVADGAHVLRKVTPDGQVSTLAGTPWQSGSEDGPAQTASFSNPTGIAVDLAGNVYSMDSWSQTIRKLSPDGRVTTLAGSAGQFGNADGIGSAARLRGPGHLAIDAAGNVLVTDNNSAIRQITPAGLVSTWAGATGGSGSQDGSATAARFNFPNGIAIDAAGNLFVADQDNSIVRKITAAGAVTTLAGKAGVWGAADGTGAEAQFAGPGGLALDRQGNVYVTEFNNHTVRKITPAGVVTTLAGSAGHPGGADGPGADARFNGPNNLAVDAQGNVFVADYNNHRVRKISPDGVVSTFAGSGTAGAADGSGAQAQFNGPNSLVIDASGNLLVTESNNNTVRRISPAGVVSTLAGSAGQQGSADGSGAAARFSYPWGITLGANGDAYVADSGNNAIRKISPAGVVTTLAGGTGAYATQAGPLPAKLAYPIGVAADPGSNKLYVTAPDAVLVISHR